LTITRSSRAIAIISLGLCLTIGSFADEAAQIVFALRLADNTPSVSSLLAAGLLGGITAGPIAPRLIRKVGPLNLISSLFVVQALMVLVASTANQFAAYIAVAIALGCTGSLLWSAIMVAVPSFAKTDKQINQANRVIQTVRNLGYVCGPAIGGLLYAKANGSAGLLLIAAFVLFAAPVTFACFKVLVQPLAETDQQDRKHKGLDIEGLYKTRGVLLAVAPLLVTVVLTSALNVLLVIRVRHNLNLPPEAYGIIVSALSIGLIVGPLTLGAAIGKLGDAAGASLAAGVIGLGILGLAFSLSELLMIAMTFLIGVANGVQNALMGSFMMKAVEKTRRFSQMPAYVLSLQTSVFIGFISAGFVRNEDTATALAAIGVITAIVGIVGLALNLNNRPSIASEGAR